MTVRTSA